MNKTIEDINYNDNRSFDDKLFGYYAELCDFLQIKYTEDGFQRYTAFALDEMKNATE